MTKSEATSVLPEIVGQSYTHAIHARRCHQLALQGVVAANTRVQVQKRGVTYCAVIKAAWTAPNDLDCWTVETSSPESARFTVPCKFVRQCAGLDDSCSCAGELPTAEKGGTRVSGGFPFSGVGADGFLGEVAVTPHLSLKNETFSPFCYTLVTSPGASK